MSFSRCWRSLWRRRLPWWSWSWSWTWWWSRESSPPPVVWVRLLVLLLDLEGAAPPEFFLFAGTAPPTPRREPPRRLTLARDPPPSARWACTAFSRRPRLPKPQRQSSGVRDSPRNGTGWAPPCRPSQTHTRRARSGRRTSPSTRWSWCWSWLLEARQPICRGTTPTHWTQSDSQWSAACRTSEGGNAK